MKAYFLWLAKFITVLLVFLFFIPLLLTAIMTVSQQGAEVKVSSSREQVAVIELTGMITDSKEILEQFEKHTANDRIKGIVLAIDSPGGAVAPSQDIYSAVRRAKAKKPVVASFGSVAASGGLYAALGASKVLAQPGTITGSIGVIFQVPNFTKVTQQLGVDMVTIKSGQLKDVGNSFREMTPEERAFLEQTVSVAHADFIDAVSEGRGIPREKVVTFADGRIILGSQAKELNLIDGYGDRYEAARMVFDVLGAPLPEGQYPTLVYEKDSFKHLREVLQGAKAILPFAKMRPEWNLSYLMY